MTKKGVVSILLVTVMLFTVISAGVFAEEETAIDSMPLLEMEENAEALSAVSSEDGTLAPEPEDTVSEPEENSEQPEQDQTNEYSSLSDSGNSEAENESLPEQSDTSSGDEEKSETDQQPQEPVENERETEQEEELGYPPFSQSVTENGVTVTVKAEGGVFPENAALSVTSVPAGEQELVDAAVESERSADRNVAVSYTFDIKVLDGEGNELQPVNAERVYISFALVEVANRNLDTQVYHIEDKEGELSAQPLNVDTNGEKATVTTGGFSYYTVEFTYGDKQFVMSPSDGIYLSQILEAVGIEGTPANVSFSDKTLFKTLSWDEDDIWLFSTRAFSTEEWMKVTVDGVEYQITLTDAIIKTEGTNDKDFLQNADIATVWIDKTKLTAANADVSQVGGTGGYTITGTQNAINVYGTWPRAAAQHIRDFTITYKNAAVLSNGTRKDLVFDFSGVVVHTKEMREENRQGTYTIFQKNRNGRPALFALAGADVNRYHAGVVYDNLTIKVDGADVTDTFFYTIYGINVDRREASNGRSGFSHVHDAFPGWVATTNPNNHSFGDAHGGTNAYVALADPTGNYMYSEAVKPLGGETIYKSTLTDAYQETSEGVFVAKGYPSKPNTTYQSGFAALTNAQNGFSAKYWQSAPGNEYGTELFIMPDGITHTYVSSSGWYGKIELWTDGKTDVTGTQGDLLYGGRYVNSAGVDEKRSYDVPYDKDVTYKMTPEKGCIPYKLYVDGAEKPLDDPNVNIVYNADGSVQYLTYYFEGDEAEDETVAKDVKGWDPKTSKGGFAHTIHITWQPTVDLKFKKEWQDDGNKWGLQPDSLKIELEPSPNTLSPDADGTVPVLYHHFTNDVKSTANAITSTMEYPLTAADNWKHTYYDLPKYEITDPDAGVGTLIAYKIKETLTSPYYTELLPHVIEKNDTSMSISYYANGTSQNHRGFDESGTSYVKDGCTKRTIDYTIVNRLNTGYLVIEKDSIPDDDGSFNFTVEVTHPDADMTASNWAVFPKSVTLDGDTLLSAPIELPLGTGYTVTEEEQTGWRLLGSESTSGTILSGDFWAYDIGGTLYIKDDSGYVGVDGTALVLPDNPAPPLASDPRNPASTYYFDKIGARISEDNSGTYLYGGGVQTNVSPEATPGYSVSYTPQSTASGQYVTHRSNSANASDTVIGTAVDRACFQNIKTVDLT
ncbi:MAG: Cna B-type domain-containing protein, partial [Lachnospiraceae bacterium]